MESPWNSLETWKFIVSISSPLIGGYIAWKLAMFGKDLEKKQWAGRKIIENRLIFYDKVVPELNDLYCYYHRVGNWKELEPRAVIAKKRFLDKEFNVYAHIFKQDILKKYQPFIHNCFKTYTGWGNDAKIKMSLSKRVELPNWDTTWNELFIEEEMENEKAFNMSYNALLKLIKSELEV